MVELELGALAHAVEPVAPRAHCSVLVVRPAPAAERAAISSYGDQQLLVTFYDGRGPNVWTEELVVRKGIVVWHLEVGAHPSSSKPFSRAQALAELKKYAGKQRARVSSG